MNKKNLYQEFVAMKTEIMKHKWIESEKANMDIGFEKALLDWMSKHSDNWRMYYIKKIN